MDEDKGSIDEPQIQDVEVIGTKDWFLQSMIETVINNGVEMGITLTVGGTTVSGMLISGRKYFDELGEFVGRGAPKDDIRTILGNAWREYQAIYDKPADATEDWSPPTAGYIHLRTARFYSPGKRPIPTDGGLLWRGKISAVDGWSLGNLTAPE